MQDFLRDNEESNISTVEAGGIFCLLSQFYSVAFCYFVEAKEVGSWQNFNRQK